MKKLISLFLALSFVTTALIGCTPTDTSTGTPVVKKNITEYTTEGKVTKLVGDPNATGELVMRKFHTDFGEYSKSAMDLAIEKFKVLYPNVDVKFERLTATKLDDYYEEAEKMKAEVMAGKGPDIFWAMTGMDIFKIAESGNIADMTEFFENDKNFNINDYNKTIFYSGQVDGKQYFVPTRYIIPIFLTTKSIVDKKLVDVKKFDEYYSIMDESINILKTNKENPIYKDPIEGVDSLFLCFPFSGIEWSDYKNNTVQVNTDEIKKVLEKQKGIIDNQEIDNLNSIGGFIKAKNLLKQQSVLALYYGTSFYEFLDDCRYIKTKDEPIVMPLYNIRGKVTASVVGSPMVNNSSKNKQNAYNFLKILISPEIQGYTDESNMNIGRNFDIPISNAGRDAILVKMKVSETIVSDNLTGLSQEFIDDYKKIIDDIDSVAFENVIGKIFRDEIQPYFDGESDLDTCLKSAQAKLEIYISE